MGHAFSNIVSEPIHFDPVSEANNSNAGLGVCDLGRELSWGGILFHPLSCFDNWIHWDSRN